jgi:hypothetical protein
MRSKRGTEIRQIIAGRFTEEEEAASVTTVCDCCGSVEYGVYLSEPNEHGRRLCPECVAWDEDGRTPSFATNHRH